MKAFLRFWRRLAGTFGGGRRDDDLAAELESHIQMQTEDNVRSGLPSEEARRTAVLKFGSLAAAQEAWRDQRSLPQLEMLGQDLRFALACFAKAPGFLVIAVLSLGLGIGASATLFTWFKAVYLNPLPGVVDARHLVTINGAYRDAGGMSNSYADYQHIRDHSNLFDGLFVHDYVTYAVNDGKSAEMTAGAIVSGNFFHVLGTQMALGRGFQPDEDEVLDRNPVLVLGYDLWKQGFGGDPTILGRRLELNRVPFTVIGVAPPGFIGVYGGLRQSFWVPVHMARALDFQHRDRLARGSWLQIMGRPKPGVSLAAIRANLEVLSAQIRAEYRKTQPDYRAAVYPLHDAQRGFYSAIFQMVRVLAIAVVILLALACLNVANLLTARAADRSREMSVRLSLGAGRGRILRQLLTESLLLAAMGGATGLLLAWWTRRLPLTLFGAGFDLYLNIELDWTVLAFLTGVSVSTAVAFGLLPALETTRVNLVDTLKEGAGGTTAGRRRNFWRSSLVVGQVALSMAALTGAAFFAQHLLSLERVDRGLKAENLLTAHTDVYAAGMDQSRGQIFYREAIDRLQSLPQVESAAWTTFLPMSGSGGGNTREAEVQGYVSGDGQPLSLVVDSISPGFLHTMGIPLLKGREFEWSDSGTAPPVLLVNEKFVEEYLAGREPLGASVRIGKVWCTIAGVHRNYVYRHPAAGHSPTVFLPLAQDYNSAAIVVLRTRGEPWLAAGVLREVIQRLDRNLALDRVMSMEENVASRFAETRNVTGVLLFFGAMACTLAAIGLYGVLATFVNQRRREFGVRTALGATPGDLRRLVMARGTWLTLIGCTLGIFLSVAFARLLESVVWQLKPSGLGIYLLAGGGVALVAVVSTFLPSRRAARLDPLVALRYE